MTPANVEFVNRPPAFEDIPEYRIRYFARALVRATRDYKEKQTGENNENNQAGSQNNV